MYRRRTARKSTTLDDSAIDSAKFTACYPAHRADLEPMVACKQALRLLATYTFLWLPVHCGICWLASYSLGLAATIVIGTAAAAFAVAFSKWLGLEDLLQKLPLLIIIGIGFAVFAFVTSQPNLRWVGGAESFGTFLILIMFVSVLGGLYRPMSAAYQTVTLKTSFRDLCVGAMAMLISLGLAALAQSLPRFGFTLLMCTIVGGYSGLVVLEYAAWARANPNVSLERAVAFTEPTTVVGEPASTAKPEFQADSALLGASVFGLGFGILTVCNNHLSSPSLQFHRFLLALTDKEYGRASEMFTAFVLVGLLAMPVGFCMTALSLDAFKFANILLGLRYAWDAVVNFLTYPETNHPLVHKFYTPWLRPVSVRMALTGLVLVFVATSSFLPSENPPSADSKTKSGANVQSSPPPANPQLVGAGDAELARIFGLPGADFRDRPIEQPLKGTAPASSSQLQSNTVFPEVAFHAIVLVAMPPAFIYLMVWFVGCTVLPIHFNYFEKSQPQNPTA